MVGLVPIQPAQLETSAVEVEAIRREPRLSKSDAPDVVVYASAILVEPDEHLVELRSLFVPQLDDPTSPRTRSEKDEASPGGTSRFSEATARSPSRNSAVSVSVSAALP
jgi:hypothetical protein